MTSRTQTIVDVTFLKDLDSAEAINTLAYILQSGVFGSFYGYSTPTNGSTVTAPAGENRRILAPAGTLSTLTLVLPPTPLDGAIYEIMSTQQITTLSIVATGKTVRGNIFTLTPDSGASWLYRSANSTWYVRY